MSDEQTNDERLLVTSALPYANGQIHIGHLVEYIQTDIFVRYHRLRGTDVIYMCASDTHGTPIELKARELGIEPEALVADFNRQHKHDFDRFSVSFDRFYTTHSPETEHHAQAIFAELTERGLIYTKEVDLTYCETDERFLPDRYVRGTCPNPRCRAEDQFGDNCEVCGSTYDPTDLADAKCVLCGNPPVRRSSKHYFFKLGECRPQITAWVDGEGHLHENTRNWLHASFLSGDLRDWDISRDGPYFGFRIPGETDKFFYVWMDAPIGYIGTTQKFCDENPGRDFDKYWKEPGTRIVHVIGKDIAYFHTLFWPAVLANSGYRTPDLVQVHGFLTVDGQKMSKRTGTAVTAETYLEHLDPQYLRFYYACKLGPTNIDIDLQQDDFVNRVNADLVNKISNLASRAHAFVARKLDGRLGTQDPDAGALVDETAARFARIAEAYERFEFARALKEIITISEQANKYFQDAAPFHVIKDDPERARAICTTALNFVRVLAILVKPVVPELSARIERSLDLPPQSWDDLAFDLQERSLGEFERLADRLKPKQVAAMIAAQRDKSEAPAPTEEAPESEPIADEIDIDAFAQVDLRVAEVIEAKGVDGAKKLLELRLNLGDHQRTVFAGIKKYYEPQTLVGRKVIMVANLKPRKMRFGVSEGMVLAAASGEELFVLGIDDRARPGSRVS